MNVRELAADISLELREHPERWIQGAMWRNDAGEYRGHEPTSWCLLGHITRRIDEEKEIQIIESWYEALAPIKGEKFSIVVYNDFPGRTVQEIIDLCDHVASS